MSDHYSRECMPKQGSADQSPRQQRAYSHSKSINSNCTTHNKNDDRVLDEPVHNNYHPGTVDTMGDFVSDHMNPCIYLDNNRSLLNYRGDNYDGDMHNEKYDASSSSNGYWEKDFNSHTKGIFRNNNQRGVSESIVDKSTTYQSNNRRIRYSRSFDEGNDHPFPPYLDVSNLTIPVIHPCKINQPIPLGAQTIISPLASTATFHSSNRSATFPFKPASELTKFQNQISRQNSTDIDVTRSNHKNNKLPFSKNSDSIKRDAPSSLKSKHISYESPRRSASFPSDSSHHSSSSLVNNHRQSSMLETPNQLFAYSMDYMHNLLEDPLKSPEAVNSENQVDQCIRHTSEEYETSAMFPVCIDLPEDNDCWWLNDLFNHALKRFDTAVHIGEDEIEVVDSQEEMEIPEAVKEIEDCNNVEKNEEVVLPQFIGDKLVIEMKEIPTPLLSASDNPNKLSTMSLNFVKRIDHSDEARRSLDSITIAEADSFDNECITDGVVSVSRQLYDQTKNDDMNESFRRKTSSDGKPNADANDDYRKCSKQPEKSINNKEAVDHVRRTTVAITGATLVTTGVVLIPLPIIPGSLVVYGGLMILASEFEGAKKALDVVKGPLAKFLADDQEDKDAGYFDDELEEGHNDSGVLFSWKQTVSFLPDNHKWRKADIDADFTTLMGTTNINAANNGHDCGKDPNNSNSCRNDKSNGKITSQEHSTSRDATEHEKAEQAEVRARKNAMKRWMRNLLKLDSGVGDGDNDGDNSDVNSCKKDGSSDKPHAGGQDTGNINGTGESHQQGKILLRADSNCTILTSCGEEVDANGVKSDSIHYINDETGIIYAGDILDVANSKSYIRQISEDSIGSISLNVQNDSSGCRLYCRGGIGEESVGDVTNWIWTCHAGDNVVADEEVDF